jgi:hypothetical protein
LPGGGFGEGRLRRIRLDVLAFSGNGEAVLQERRLKFSPLPEVDATSASDTRGMASRYFQNR